MSIKSFTLASETIEKCNWRIRLEMRENGTFKTRGTIEIGDDAEDYQVNKEVLKERVRKFYSDNRERILNERREK